MTLLRRGMNPSIRIHRLEISCASDRTTHFVKTTPCAQLYGLCARSKLLLLSGIGQPDTFRKTFVGAFDQTHWLNIPPSTSIFKPSQMATSPSRTENCERVPLKLLVWYGFLRGNLRTISNGRIDWTTTKVTGSSSACSARRGICTANNESEEDASRSMQVESL